jgi:Domain of unknown function (DUF397)
VSDMNAASPDWRKSNRSSNEGGNCVEAAKVTRAAAALIKAATTK